ncbi:uncharacterized protein LOC129535107 isoform X3 [Moschus berezovskii]|uniref:uncharacterized protein LOC129535107 isoform X3 n=1 Tax=Moschus berezovskii TaxID=68408 RepID=UPI0024448C3F|nr:uncharacterized protein LOC129535107 isoform X3 [Moschus berezovskii]
MHWRITDAGLGETSQTLSVGTECPLLQRTDAGRSHKLVGDCCPTFSFASRRQEVLVTQMAGGPRTRKETTQFCKLTWDDCQQLLQILFTTEERERIQAETRKKVPGANGEATNNIDEINASFPLSRPEWDFNMAQDDLLVADQDYQTCLAGTKDLLRTIGELGYRASAKKAQICKPEVTYLGYVLRDGQRWLSEARKETVLKIPPPDDPPKGQRISRLGRILPSIDSRLCRAAAAAAAKSLQSCPTLCDPIDGSPPGSPVPGILQARTPEWVAISFSNVRK